MATTLSNVDLPQLPGANYLNGQNYLQGAQFTRHMLKGKCRLNHIEGANKFSGKASKPRTSNPRNMKLILKKQGGSLVLSL